MQESLLETGYRPAGSGNTPSQGDIISRRSGIRNRWCHCPPADVDNACPGSIQKPFQKQTGQGEMPQVVGSKLKLEIILGFGKGQLYHSGVVDQ